MVFKATVIEERLKALAEALAHLHELKLLAYDPFHKEFRNLWSAERGFQIAAETLFDIGNHILSRHFQAAPRQILVWIDQNKESRK
jgi:uncharacterized protein YutE (UPF0331/DUF86 family)